MAIIKRSLGNNRQIIIEHFREEWTDGLGGLAFKAFSDGWKCAWNECIEQSPKLKSKRIEELEAELKHYKSMAAKAYTACGNYQQRIEELEDIMKEIAKGKYSTEGHAGWFLAEQALKG